MLLLKSDRTDAGIRPATVTLQYEPTSLSLKNYCKTFEFLTLVGQFLSFPDLSPPDRLTLRI